MIFIGTIKSQKRRDKVKIKIFKFKPLVYDELKNLFDQDKLALYQKSNKDKNNSKQLKKSRLNEK